MALPGLVAAKNLADVTDRERAWDSLGLNMSADYSAVPLGIAPGTPFGGGFFAGFISHTADGNPTHALIVAPVATGATGNGYTLSTSLAWAIDATTNGVNYSSTSIGENAAKDYDGVSVMNQIVALGNISNFPAFEFCKNLAIGGYSDWYLPSRFELDIAYFNLKPTTATNSPGRGVNAYAVPKREDTYTSTYPTQTTVSLFTSTEAFYLAGTNNSAYHQTASEVSATTFRPVSFLSSLDTAQTKTNVGTAIRLRAFRRIAL